MVSEGAATRTTRSSEKPNQCFEKIKKEKNILVKLLLRISNLVNDRIVIIAFGVCNGWRDAISFGLTRLSFSWCKKNINSNKVKLLCANGKSNNFFG